MIEFNVAERLPRMFEAIEAGALANQRHPTKRTCAYRDGFGHPCVIGSGFDDAEAKFLDEKGLNERKISALAEGFHNPKTAEEEGPVLKLIVPDGKDEKYVLRRLQDAQTSHDSGQIENVMMSLVEIKHYIEQV